MSRILFGLFKGILIGAGAILPGISGASLAVVFGVYEDFTALLAHPLRNLRPFIRRHASLCAGIAAGFIVLSLLLDRLFGSNTTELVFLFSGFIAGTLPGIYREARKQGIGVGEIISFCAASAFFFLAALAGMSGASAGDNPSGLACPAAANAATRVHPLLWALTGAIIGAGSLMPGVSASFILIYMGMYGPLLEAIGHRSAGALLLVGGGALLALLLLSRLVNALYRHFHGIVSFAVLGCTLGSLVLVFPGFASGTNPAVCVALALAGFAASFFLDSAV